MLNIKIVCIVALLQILELVCLKYCYAGIFRLCKLKVARLAFFLHKMPTVRLLSACMFSFCVIMPYAESVLNFVLMYFFYFYLVVSDNKRRKYITGKGALTRLIFLSMPMIIIGCYHATEMGNCAVKYIHGNMVMMFLMLVPFIYLLVVKWSQIRLVKFFNRLGKLTKLVGLITFSVGMFCMNFECQPMACVITILFFGIVPYIFLSDSPKYLWVVYFLVVMWRCYNQHYVGSAEDEMMWRITDTPIDFPEQWHDNFTYFRVMTCIMNGVMSSSFWNILIYFVYKLFLFAHDTSCRSYKEEL